MDYLLSNQRKEAGQMPPRGGRQSTLADLLKGYRLADRWSEVSRAVPAELLAAPLMSVEFEPDDTVVLMLAPAGVPEGGSLVRCEDFLAGVLGAPAAALSLYFSTDQENSAAVASRLLPWVKDDWLGRHGFIALVLAEAGVRVEENCLIISLPQSLKGQTERAVAGGLDSFFRRRTNLSFELRLELAEFCREKAARKQEEVLRSVIAVQAPPELSKASAAAGDSLSSDLQSPAPAYKRQRPAYKKKDDVYYGRINRNLTPVPISDLDMDTGMARFVGQVVNLESKLVSQGTKVLLKFDAFGQGGAIACRIFLQPEAASELEQVLARSPWCGFEGEVAYNNFDRDITCMVKGIEPAAAPPRRTDNLAEKRVELHCHTKMSSQDAMSAPADLVDLAVSFGHPALAITDHGVVQALPEAYEAAARHNKEGEVIKLIPGMEGYLVNDGEVCVYGLDKLELGDSFVALDLETTGLDPSVDRIIEIAAIRFRRSTDGAFTCCEEESFHTLCNPGVGLTETITKLTGLTDFDLLGAPDCFDCLPALKDFIGGDPVVGHNILFDLGFLRYEGFRTADEHDPRIHFNPTVIDTVNLSRFALPDLPNHRLDTVAEELEVELENHHRALDDAICAGRVFSSLYSRLGSPELEELNRRLGRMEEADIIRRKTPSYHIIFLAKDELGLYHLYRLVSKSHTCYFSHRPRIPKSYLTYLKAGLIVGGACEAGEIFRAVRELYHQSGSHYDLAKEQLQQKRYKQLARYYDYLEIQPLENNQYLLHLPDSGVRSKEDLANLNRLVLDLGRLAGRPVVATTDSHFLNREDALYRSIMQTNMGFKDADSQPGLYYRTTEEMLACFGYLGEEVAREVVIRNPKAISDRVKSGMRPFPDGSFPPNIPTADEAVRAETWSTARMFYEKDGTLPEIVEKRVEKELKSIIDNGFAVMYYIAERLVKKSNEDGYIVGSRGSVGSSLVASFCGITEVNPLEPHYRCPACKYSEFILDGSYGSGFDLPAKACPDCGHDLVRDGQDIPFETFLGFNGDKQPDIDLNFSGEYQPRAHRYVVEMFGPDHTYRAGTIGSYAEKNAEGLVRGYLEQRNRQANRATIRQMASGLNGVKRTTGQHPGGIVVIPKDREVYDFTPVQYPANDLSAVMTTTHFDFNSMHDTVLKLDILGHMDPTMLKMLGDITGVEVASIPIPDEKVMALFESAAPLGLKPGMTSIDSGTLGLPELGTPMARDMISETKPTRFYNLVQLMGLSHGTDVWKGNAQDLIREGTCTIDEVIGCRDGIMTSLIHWGLPPKTSFDIMERVRKGRGLLPEQEEAMRVGGVPNWYIESCKKIKYMFPKAHAAAYSISSLRIAWFKVYHPRAFYAAYFTVRAARQFDARLMCRDQSGVRSAMQELRRKTQSFDATEKDKKQLELLELVEEMQARGFELLPVDLMASAASKFKLEGEKGVRPALDTCPGISSAQAEKIVAVRDTEGFKSQEELARKAGLGQAAMAALAEQGCLEGLPESDQMDLFAMLG